jgi:hypothetical protein
MPCGRNASSVAAGFGVSLGAGRCGRGDHLGGGATTGFFGGSVLGERSRGLGSGFAAPSSRLGSAVGLWAVAVTSGVAARSGSGAGAVAVGGATGEGDELAEPASSEAARSLRRAALSAAMMTRPATRAAPKSTRWIIDRLLR